MGDFRGNEQEPVCEAIGRHDELLHRDERHRFKNANLGTDPKCLLLTEVAPRPKSFSAFFRHVLFLLEILFI